MNRMNKKMVSKKHVITRRKQGVTYEEKWETQIREFSSQIQEKQGISFIEGIKQRCPDIALKLIDIALKLKL